MEADMHKLSLLIAAAVVVLGAAVLSTSAEAGCYRLGETGYHWYGSCVGPYWLYPHRRVCRHGACWYR